MTPALKAMVEAMAAEITEQDCRIKLDADGDMNSGYDGACFNLEKVARAGLAAIPPEAMGRALCAAYGEDPEQDWRGAGDVMLAVEVDNPAMWALRGRQARAMIDAILKETPVMITFDQVLHELHDRPHTAPKPEAVELTHDERDWLRLDRDGFLAGYWGNPTPTDQEEEEETLFGLAVRIVDAPGPSRILPAP